MAKLYGGIEAGGTKFICGVGSSPQDIIDQVSIPTTTPSETLAQAVDFFQPHSDKVEAFGISSFGPVDPDPASPGFGYITTTPKPNWAHTDLVGPIRTIFDKPVGFDTDVNGAALGEHLWGAGQGLDTFIYLTIGTGIGGGGLMSGRLMHGLLHPEMGHIRLPHDLSRDPFPGICPYHGDCFEGLACGPAIEARWGIPAEQLPADHPAWELEAGYIALALTNFILTLSPERIILGGGVMAQDQLLLPNIRTEVQRLLNGYVQVQPILTGIDDYIVPTPNPGLSGLLGAFALAERAFLAQA